MKNTKLFLYILVVLIALLVAAIHSGLVRIKKWIFQRPGAKTGA